VWAQIVREAARRRRDVLFVTGDVKEDWWRRHRGQFRGPRVDRSLTVDPAGGWSQEAMNEFLETLSFRAPVQETVVRFAAENGGFISRQKVYESGFSVPPPLIPLIRAWNAQEV
jgi:hypothetical protein